MTKQAKKGTYEGVIQVCLHDVSFSFDIGRCTLTRRLQELLEEEAEERAKACICEEVWSGDLCVNYLAGNGREVEMFGWWSIGTNDEGV